MSGWKTIALREEAYNKLKAIKKEDQTFSDIVELLIQETELELIMKDTMEKMKGEKEEDKENTKTIEDISELVNSIGALRE